MRVFFALLFASVDAVILYRLTKLAFPERDDFLEALRFWFQPWWLSALRREYFADLLNEAKLMGLILAMFMLVFLEYAFFADMMDYLR